MATFKVLFHVVLPEPITGDTGSVSGFYVPRHVEAADLHEASAAGIALLNSEAHFQDIAAQSPDDPWIHVSSVEPLAIPVDAAVNATGYVFYPTPAARHSWLQSVATPEFARFAGSVLLGLVLLWLLATFM